MTPIYPYNYPLILNDTIFAQYGGKLGSFPSAILNAAYQIAEQETTEYIGTFLLPTVVSGTFVTVPTHTQRISTDYGYVSQIYNVTVKTQKLSVSGGAELINRDGAAFIYSDTFGYVDVYKLQNACGVGYLSGFPYQYQIVYEAGLPTGTANLPSMLMAMTMIAQINLNEMFPGEVGMNEAVGDVGVQEFMSFRYNERRTAHALVRTSFGGSAQANKAAQLIKSCVKLARHSLRIG